MSKNRTFRMSLYLTEKRIIRKTEKQRKEQHMLSTKLLKILACPKCKGELVYKSEENKLICNYCKLVFMIEDDIPNMLIEEAKPLE